MHTHFTRVFSSECKFTREISEFYPTDKLGTLHLHEFSRLELSVVVKTLSFFCWKTLNPLPFPGTA